MSKQMQMLGLVGWLAVAFGAAAVGAVASVDAEVFYSELTRPGWAPPPSVFGPVWTVLYVLMGVAVWLVWLDGGFRLHRATLALFLIQLAANALWSWLFFAWNKGNWALADILLLWLLLVATLGAFWRARPISGVLLLPYLLWVSFAVFLNYSVWQLNPETLN
jgi:translocator protein